MYHFVMKIKGQEKKALMAHAPIQKVLPEGVQH